MSSHRIQAAALLLLGLFFPVSMLYAGPPPSSPNSVLQASAKGLARLDVRLSAYKEPFRFEFKGENGVVAGAITLPSDAATDYEITAIDENGKATHSGKGTIPPLADDTRPMELPLPPIGDGNGLVVSLTRERVVLTVKEGEANQFTVHADLLDPLGNPTKIDPIEIRWGLSDGRDLKLVPIPGTYDVDVRPFKETKLERLCVAPPDVYACIPNGHCRPIPVCSDPWITISAGTSHTCALTQSGLAYCWGANHDGQLGAQTTTSCSPNASFNSSCSTKPVAVTCPAGAPCRFTRISAGETLTAAIDSNGDAWWWGRGGVAHHKVTATLAGSSVKFTQIAAGFGHACAISQNRSEIWCWGTNGYGESGLPAQNPQEVPDWSPSRVLVPFKFQKIVAGGEHTCALGSAGTDVVCWGRDTEKQVSGTSASQVGQFFFQQFGGLTLINDIAASRSSSCATLGWGNGVKCWGTHALHNVAPFGTPDRLTAGDGQVCALNGQLASCVGTNNWGELGTGNMISPSAPVPVKAPPPLYAAISAGASHTCGLTPDGNAYCWGNNMSGQVGTGGTNYSVKEPAAVVKP